MCPRNHLLGLCVMAFGIGLLMGQCFTSGLFCNVLAIGLIFLGICVLRQKF